MCGQELWAPLGLGFHALCGAGRRPRRRGIESTASDARDIGCPAIACGVILTLLTACRQKNRDSSRRRPPQTVELPVQRCTPIWKHRQHRGVNT